jgi:DNA-binding NarL/FixJ family response regulator
MPSRNDQASARVLVVDDHSMIREWLCAHLEAHGFEASDAASGAEAIAAAEDRRPHAVVLDLSLPDMRGAEVARSIRERVPEAAVLILTASLDTESVAGAIEAGACAYLLKDDDDLDLPGAIRKALRGESVLDTRAAAALARTFARGREPALLLTPSEVRMLELAARGMTNDEIGAALRLSKHTVKEYLSNAMRKLDADSRIEAVLEAARRGLISIESRGAERGRRRRAGGSIS